MRGNKCFMRLWLLCAVRVTTSTTTNAAHDSEQQGRSSLKSSRRKLNKTKSDTPIHVSWCLVSDANLKLTLRPSNNLVDDSFAFIMRDEDAPKIYENSYMMAEKYANCFYQGDNSAFDLCDGNIVSIRTCRYTQSAGCLLEHICSECWVELVGSYWGHWHNWQACWSKSLFT